MRPSCTLRNIAAISSPNDSVPEVLSSVICKVEGNVNTIFLVMKVDYFRKGYMKCQKAFSLKKESEI